MSRPDGGSSFRAARKGCARRAGRLFSGNTAFFAKKAAGRKPRGGIPPSGLPQNASRLSFACGDISPVRWGQFQAFRLSGKRCTPAETGGRRPPTWRGVERGTRSSPLLLFFPRFLFEKRNRAPTGQAACPARANTHRGCPGTRRPVHADAPPLMAGTLRLKQSLSDGHRPRYPPSLLLDVHPTPPAKNHSGLPCNGSGGESILWNTAPGSLSLCLPRCESARNAVWLPHPRATSERDVL